MTTPLLEAEGTWEEIAPRIPDFSGRRLHVIVLPAEENGQKASSEEIAARLKAMQEIEELGKHMNPKPDTRDWLREGRAGAMYGYDPVE